MELVWDWVFLGGSKRLVLLMFYAVMIESLRKMKIPLAMGG